jgi:hypothetical protein
MSKDSVANKSGFLAGILRRYMKDKSAGSVLAPPSRQRSGSSTGGGPSKEDDGDELENVEIQAILEEEGVLAEEEGKAADELEKLTGNSGPLGVHQ